VARLRLIARFFVLGLLWLGAQTLAHAVAGPAREVLVVRVHRGAVANAADEAEAIREALLLRRAEEDGFPYSDAVVRDRLVRNMRFADPQSSETDRALRDAAIEMGMHLSDSVARARLLDRSRRYLLERFPVVEPSEGELAAYLEQHADRYRRAPTSSFHQVFLSRERRPGTLATDAQQMGERLRSKAPGASAAAGLSDPGLLPASIGGTASRIDGRFGPGFFARIAPLPLKRWSGPIPSSYGLHFVWLERRDSGVLPSLRELRPRLRDHWREDRVRGHLNERVDELAQSYKVELRREP
jgi:hypothetical protein